MEQSILNTVKKVIGINEDDTSFDLDITININSVFSTLNQMGIGPGDMVAGPNDFQIEDAGATWDDLSFSPKLLNMVKTYVYLKVRHMFDPPSTGFHADATERQIAEHEWRLAAFREDLIPLPVTTPPILPEEAFWWWEQG